MNPTLSLDDVALLVSSSLLMLVTVLERLRDIALPDYVMAVAAALGAG
jgi:hypothetical protein